MNVGEPQAEFLAQVEEDLEAAAEVANGYRRRHRHMAIGGVVSGGVAAALTGGVATGGPALADAIGGWRLVCVLAAVAAAGAAILAGIQERLRIPDHVAKAEACVAQLTALRFSLRTGAGDLETRRSEYRDILREYNRYMLEGR